MTKTYTGAEFMNALAGGELRTPIAREGMVKLYENGEGYDRRTILFAEDLSCESWIKVPVEMIDQVEYLATVGCKDHEHPLVRLHLKQPPGENQIARVLGEFLLRAESRQQSGSMTEGAPCRPFRGPCKRNEDGVYTRYIRYADCSDKEEPCSPPSVPGDLNISTRETKFPCIFTLSTSKLGA